MTCASTIPWPCGAPIAGGSHALGQILCARHLAAILAPLRPPLLDRVALRRHHRASTVYRAEKPANPGNALEPELVDAIVALAPLGATLHEHRSWYPWYPTQSTISMTPRTPVEPRYGVALPDDARMPANARSVARKAAERGWIVRCTIADTNVLVNLRWVATHIALQWQDGRFEHAWKLAEGNLEPLGLRAAQALL